MAFAEDFPVSDMAISQANSHAEHAASDDDPALQIASLVMHGINSFSRVPVEAEYGDFLQYDPTDFTLGVMMCAKVLVESGLEVDDATLEGLKQRVRDISLTLSRHLEERHQGEDLRKFYRPEDGGNG